MKIGSSDGRSPGSSFDEMILSGSATADEICQLGFSAQGLPRDNGSPVATGSVKHVRGAALT